MSLEPKTFGKMKSFDLNCSVRLSTKKHIYIFEDDHDDDNADESPELIEIDSEDESGNKEENGKNGGEMSEIERIAGNMPKEGDMEEDNKSDLEPESEEEAEVFLLHSWQNERRTHMIRQRIIA